MSKNKLPTPEEIAEKRKNFVNNGEEINKKKGSKTNQFLSLIEEDIKIGIDKGWSYRTIAKTIENTYSFKVSEQTLRAYAYNVMGVPKKTRKKAVSETGKATEKTVKSSLDLKKEMAEKPQDEDTL